MDWSKFSAIATLVVAALVGLYKGLTGLGIGLPGWVLTVLSILGGIFGVAVTAGIYQAKAQISQLKLQLKR